MLSSKSSEKSRAFGHPLSTTLNDAEQISDLRHKIQSLETHVIEIKQSMFKKHSELQAHETLSERTLNAQLHTTNSAENKESSKNCVEENILKQWQEVKLKRHREFIHLKSIEKKRQESQDKASNDTILGRKQNQSNLYLKSTTNQPKCTAAEKTRRSKSIGNKGSKSKHLQAKINQDSDFEVNELKYMKTFI